MIPRDGTVLTSTYFNKWETDMWIPRVNSRFIIIMPLIVWIWLVPMWFGFKLTVILIQLPFWIMWKILTIGRRHDRA